MLNRIRTAQKNTEGFTLIELLIVIVVLGVLAGIVVFGVSTFKGDSETAACKADVKTVSVAVDAYYAKTGNTPPTSIGPTSTSTNPLLGLNYLKSAPATTVTIAGTAPYSASATCGGQTYTQ